MLNAENGRRKKLVPRRVHSPNEFLIFIIHVVRLRKAHVDLRNKSYERETKITNKPIRIQNTKTEPS